MAKEKHYRHKIENCMAAHVIDQDQPLTANYPVGMMLIASPTWVEEYLISIPEGEVRTMNQMRQGLAERAKADYTCPMTTGIFLRMVAEAAQYERQHGMPVKAPWWRVVTNDGSLNPRLPGGGELQLQLLLAEGVKVVAGLKSKKTRMEVVGLAS